MSLMLLFAGAGTTPVWAAAPTESLEFSSAASATTLTFTGFGADIPAGTFIAIGHASNVAGLTATCTDNSLQVGTANVYVSRTPRAGTTLTGGIIWTYTTRKILTTDTITVTLSAAATRRDGRLVTFVVGGIPALDGVANQDNRVASPITMGPTATLIASNELALGFSFWKGGAVTSGVADATGGYTLIVAAGSGGAATRVETNLAYKSPVGTAAETDTHTFTTFTAGCGEILTFTPSGGTIPTASTGGFLLMGVGT